MAKPRVAPVIDEPESDATDLVVAVREVVPAVLFSSPENVDALLARLKQEVLAQERDVSTKDGRAAIVSLRYKLKRSKTALDEMGKKLNETKRAEINVVDAERRKIRADIEALEDEVGAEYEAWLTRDERRIAAHEAELAAIPKPEGYGTRETAAELARRIVELETLPPRDWQEFERRAQKVVAAEIERTRALLRVVEAREHAAAEEAARVAREADERRVAAHRQAMADIVALGLLAEASDPSSRLLIIRDRIETLPARDWENFAVLAAEERARALQIVETALAAALAREAKEQADREAEAAARAAEAARVTAEAKAQAEIAEAAQRQRDAEEAARRAAEELAESERRAAEDLAVAQRLLKEAQDRAQDERDAAEAKRVAAHEARLKSICDYVPVPLGAMAAKISEIIAVVEEMQPPDSFIEWQEYSERAATACAAVLDTLRLAFAEAEQREAAVAAEVKRIADEAEAKRIETAKAEAVAEERRRAASAPAPTAASATPPDRAAQGRVNTAAAGALVQHCGLKDGQARAVVVAIAQGKIPGVSISYT